MNENENVKEANTPIGNAIHIAKQICTPEMQSPHEGYAFIRERMDYLEKSMDWARMNVDRLWDNVKSQAIRQGNKHAIKEVGYITKAATNIAEKAVELAALAQKFEELAKKAHGEGDASETTVP